MIPAFVGALYGSLWYLGMRVPVVFSGPRGWGSFYVSLMGSVTFHTRQMFLKIGKSLRFFTNTIQSSARIGLSNCKHGRCAVVNLALYILYTRIQIFMLNVSVHYEFTSVNLSKITFLIVVYVYMFRSNL